MKKFLGLLKGKIEASVSYPDPQEITFVFNANERGTSESTSVYEGRTMNSRIRVNTWEYNVFGQDIVNHDGWKIDGAQTSLEGDNMPPILNSGNVGGLHGYGASAFTLPGTELTEADDIFSIWQRVGTTDQMILFSVYGDVARFLPLVGLASDGEYEHISGATHTSNLVLSGRVSKSYYPSIKKISKKLFIDEVEKSTSVSATYVATENIRIEEVYDILTLDSIKAHLPTLQGTGEALKQGEGDSLIRCTHNFIIDETGFQTGLFSMEALQDVPDFKYWMALQQINLGTTGDFWYLPKTLPYTLPEGTFDFRQLQPWRSDFTADARFTASYYEKPTETPDRQLIVLNSKGSVFVQGFLPVRDAAFDTRLNRTNEAFSLNDGSIKYYMKAAYNTKVGSLTTGEKYEVIAYRGIVPIRAERTSSYFVKDYTTGKSYFYGDWHDLPKTDTIDIPLGLQGSQYTVIDKTDNITLLNGTLGSSLVVTINDTHVYGYLTLEIN